MDILLDTHTLLWWLNEHERLSPTARSLLIDESNSLHISIASMWEVAIKVSLGKLTGLSGGVKTLITRLYEIPVSLIPVMTSHVELVEDLPFIHRDPFDRLIVATAKAEDMTIMTIDDNIRKYDVQTIW